MFADFYRGDTRDLASEIVKGHWPTDPGQAAAGPAFLAHRLVVDHVGVISFPESTKQVWHMPQLAVLVLAGVVIAVLGALIPARSAARLTIAPEATGKT
ncbi:hypothetical protein LRS74_30430 [Streptomyces sp. LX-29]|uniref:hypothetical protein n=1 Tax=Streptomyces sp. LX-29 TaxID=2900152 RepID=UPI00240D8224|nr:hypothetical protein [Streptomyces sp. LX-29]WFB10884.1 hypothetical protein LRS74_30430 [Streptomyces sp. LX-29]